MFYWTGGASWYAIGSGKLDQDTWYHLAGTFDGKTLKFYVDGKLVGQKGSKSKCRRQRYIHWMSSKPDQLATTGLGAGAAAVYPVDKLSTQWARIKSGS